MADSFLEDLFERIRQEIERVFREEIDKQYRKLTDALKTDLIAKFKTANDGDSFGEGLTVTRAGDKEFTLVFRKNIATYSKVRQPSCAPISSSGAIFLFRAIFRMCLCVA